MIILKNVVSVNNGGDGFHIDGQVHAEGLTAIDNGGAGLRLREGADGSAISEVLTQGNKGAGVVVEGPETLTEQFPVLRGYDGDLISEISAILDATNGDDERQRALKSSDLGTWLANQRFTEWATLVAAIAALFPS